MLAIDRISMSRSRKNRKDRLRQQLASYTVNTLPGSVESKKDAPHPVITVIAYGPNDLVEKKVTGVKDIEPFLSKYPVTWVNVDGLGDAEVIKEIGRFFHIHNLALEDVMTFHQRAKVENYDDQFYIVGHMLKWVDDEIKVEQLNIFLGKNFVVTFQDGPIDCMNPARERIRKGTGRLRSSGPDYLAYSLLDTVIDSYFPILENYGDSLEDLEELIIEKPTRAVIGKIHKIKRDLLILRRSIWPLREAVNSLLRDSPEAFQKETLIHLRDCYDHAVQILDFIETYRELSADLQDVYLSSISNRMNEIMKVLTIITTLCVPPTLVAGIYGMNFDPHASPYNMPELHWFFGYPFALSLMAVIASITLIIMWMKGWLGETPFQPDSHDPPDSRLSDARVASDPRIVQHSGVSIESGVSANSIESGASAKPGSMPSPGSGTLPTSQSPIQSENKQE
jgi:magnesium transporter